MCEQGVALVLYDISSASFSMADMPNLHRFAKVVVFNVMTCTTNSRVNYML